MASVEVTSLEILGAVSLSPTPGFVFVVNVIKQEKRTEEEETRDLGGKLEKNIHIARNMT